MEELLREDEDEDMNGVEDVCCARRHLRYRDQDVHSDAASKLPPPSSLQHQHQAQEQDQGQDQGQEQEQRPQRLPAGPQPEPQQPPAAGPQTHQVILPYPSPEPQPQWSLVEEMPVLLPGSSGTLRMQTSLGVLPPLDNDDDGGHYFPSASGIARLLATQTAANGIGSSLVEQPSVNSLIYATSASASSSGAEVVPAAVGAWKVF